MQQDQGKAHQSEPEVGAHPRLCAPHTPDRKFLAKTQQACEEHECEADAAVDKPERATSACTLWGLEGIRDIGCRRDHQPNRGPHKPFAMGVIDQQWIYPSSGPDCFSSPAKNSGGFTRCAASCGQA